MKDQRLSPAAAQVMHGMAHWRAEMSTLTTGYDQLCGIGDMVAVATERHAMTELPYNGMRRYSRAALAVLSMAADRKAP